MVLWAMKRGPGGLVIDGAICDVTRLKTVSIPVYAASVMPAFTRKARVKSISRWYAAA